MSLKSEEKSDEKKKDQNQTNPTSETSSIKCSSIASHHEKVTPVLAETLAHNYNDESEWITSANKKRNTKNKKNVKGNKTNKKVKQNKIKVKQVKKQPQNQNIEEKNSNSIWDQAIEQTVLSVTQPEPQSLITNEIQNIPSKVEKSPQIKTKEPLIVKEPEKSKGMFKILDLAK